MKMSSGDAKAMDNFHVRISNGVAEGITSTTKAIARIGRGCGPYFGQGLRKTFVNLGIVQEARSLTRKREAECAMTLDRIAYSSAVRKTVYICACAVLLGAALWGVIQVTTSIRLNGGFASASKAPPAMDPVAAVEIKDAVDRLLKAYYSDREEFTALTAGLNPQARILCSNMLSSVNKSGAPSAVQAAFPGADSSFREAKVLFDGRRPLVFMFRKDPGASRVKFMGLRPDIR